MGHGTDIGSECCLLGIGLEAFVNRRFFMLPEVVAGFLLQHAMQGWCPPVRLGADHKVMAPEYRQAAKFMEPEVRLGKVNAEEEPSLTSRFDIGNIPTLIVFRGGLELARQSGIMETQDIVHRISFRYRSMGT
jgi:thiol-disulfide isomerase/thioredoxin